MKIITEEIKNRMIEKNILASYGYIYIRSNGEMLAASIAKREDSPFSNQLNNLYAMNLKDCKRDEIVKLLIKIYYESVFYKENGYDFVDEKDNLIEKAIKADKKAKVIDNCMFLQVFYSRVESYFDNMIVQKLTRDGSCWCGKNKDTYKLPSSKEDEIVDYLYKLIMNFKNNIE